MTRSSFEFHSRSIVPVLIPGPARDPVEVEAAEPGFGEELQRGAEQVAIRRRRRRRQALRAPYDELAEVAELLHVGPRS